MQKIKKRAIVIGLCLFALCLSGIFGSAHVLAEEKRTVRVAFFPMDGYHIKNANGSYGGMDVEYLKRLSEYAGWNVEYVECDSWEAALALLSEQQVDLVGSAQYSEERTQIYDYADLSSGYTFGVIASGGSCSVAYEDFEAMKDLTYGMVAGYVRRQEFLEYMSSNGIEEPHIIEYDSTLELQNALESGEIDAYVHTFTEIQEGQRLLGRFAPRPFYYITYKGNSAVLAELNMAIADLKMNYPELEADLLNQFYYDKLDKSVLFTTEEKEYIAQTGTLKVGYVDGYYPFSYEKEGRFEGLTRENLDNVSAVTGLNFVYCKVDSVQDAENALQQGDIDIIAYCAGTEAIHDSEHMQVLEEYAEIPLVIVMQKDGNPGEVESLAAEKKLVSKVEEVLNLEDSAVVVCETQRDSLELVKSGEVDAAMCGGYFAENLLRTDNKYANMEITSVVNSSYYAHLAVRRDASSLLVSILDKTSFFVDAKTINEYTIQENIYLNMNLWQFLSKYSVPIMIVMFLVLCVIIFIAIHMIRDSRRIQELMYKDSGLDTWNLNYFIYCGEHKILQDRKEEYAVVCLNIIQFRRYNIIYGWNAGQELLKTIVDILDKNIDKKKEIYARNHGDRFVMLLAWKDWDAFLYRLKQLQNAIENEVYQRTDNHMATQLGIYPLADGEHDLQLAVNYTGQALDVIKDGRVSEMKIYDAAFETMIKERHERERLLDAVDIQENFTVYYQSKVDIRSDKIIGAEALVRFIDQSAGGIVRSPAFFVPYYEQNGRIAEVDFFVLESVCKMLRRRLDAGRTVVPVSVNFSRIHFIKSDFPEHYEAVLEKYHISKELIEVEITETLVVEELQQQMIKQTLDVLREKGVRLSIDDFGAGYSSLGVFEQIPASVVKLDRSFLLNQEDRGRQIKIMRGIVKLTNDLGAQIVCEGVENQEDVSIMKEIGAYVAQGYFYSKPIPEAAFEEKLDELAESEA